MNNLIELFVVQLGQDGRIIEIEQWILIVLIRVITLQLQFFI